MVVLKEIKDKRRIEIRRFTDCSNIFSMKTRKSCLKSSNWRFDMAFKRWNLTYAMRDEERAAFIADEMAPAAASRAGEIVVN